MVHVRSAVAVIVLVTALAATGWAQLPAGGEFQINDYTPDDQGYPTLCSDAHGNFTVVWESARGQDGSDRGLFGQRFDSAGAALGSEFQINTFTLDNQQFPTIACDTAGNFVVVWESNLQDGGAYGVFGQRFDSAGAAQGTEFQINTITADDQLTPTVCAAASGGFVVAWQSYMQDGDSFAIVSQRFDSTGAAQGGEVQVNTYTSSTQAFPAVACGPGGAFVVVWHSDTQDGDSYGVFGQRFDSAGAPAGTEFQLNSYTEYSQQVPAIAADQAGNFVVVWESYDYQDGDSYGIFGQRFASGGAAQGTEFQINTYTPFSQEAPSVASDAAGNFLVVWSSSHDGDGYGVFGQRFASGGAQLGTEFQVNTYTVGYQGSLASLGHVTGVASDQRGDFVVTWQSSDIFGTSQDGDGFGVFGQRFELCIGDVNHDNVVGIDELIIGVNSALGTGGELDGLSFDVNGDGVVTINELVAAVAATLNGC